MNNDISIRPAHLTGFDSQGFADQIGFTRPPRLSMRDDRFNILDENGDAVLPAALQVQVIMLWENDTRIYYPAGEYDPDSAVAPKCYSDNKIAPSEGALEPQSELCVNCPRAVRDQPSFKGTTLVSACKNRYKVACLVAGARSKVFLLDIGPASRRAYEQYRQFLKQHHAAPNQVITRLDYADKQFSFAFEAWINEATTEMVKRIAETDEPAMIVNAFDKPRQAALPAPKPQEWSQTIVTTKEEVVKAAPIIEAFAQKREQDLTTRQFEQEAPKRRGRPPKSENAGPTPDAAFAGPSTPPPASPAPKHTPEEFNRGAQATFSTPAPKYTGGFGMEAPQKPPQNIQDALNAAFGQ